MRRSPLTIACICVSLITSSAPASSSSATGGVCGGSLREVYPVAQASGNPADGILRGAAGTFEGGPPGAEMIAVSPGRLLQSRGNCSSALDSVQGEDEGASKEMPRRFAALTPQGNISASPLLTIFQNQGAEERGFVLAMLTQRDDPTMSGTNTSKAGASTRSRTLSSQNARYPSGHPLPHSGRFLYSLRSGRVGTYKVSAALVWSLRHTLTPPHTASPPTPSTRKRRRSRSTSPGRSSSAEAWLDGGLYPKP